MWKRLVLKTLKTSTHRGFTLIELLVVMALILIITTVSIAGYFPFITKIEYENVVMDVALNIREYQLYGVGTKQNTTASTFDYGYGFRAMAGGSAVTFFEDRNGANDGVYNNNGDANLLACTAAECLKSVLMNGYTVESINLVLAGAPTNAISPVDITFKRPYLDAKIISGGTQYDQANICITDEANVVTRYVKIRVFRTGQISAVPTSDPITCRDT